MAIYRGPGGAGDATGDATNASALALAAKNEAQASATSAASSATAASNSATAADTSADEAAASATSAASSASGASNSATAAASSATNAASSATAAASSASAASTSASSASSSASAASTYASNASTSATNAASSASSASTSASEAAASAASISNRVISVTDNTNAALRITQLGTGNALLVEDSANPDSTPFVIDASGKVNKGSTTWYAAAGVTPDTQFNGTGTQASIGLNAWQAGTNVQARLYFNRSDSSTQGDFTDVVDSGDNLGSIHWTGSDGTAFIEAASINAAVDGTPGTNDMPGRLVFSTTADGASSPTERMRISNAGNVGIGSSSIANVSLRLSKNVTGSATSYSFYNEPTVQSDVTATAYANRTNFNTAAAAFTLSSMVHYGAQQGTIGAGSAVITQYGFLADSGLTGATNNYGFYGNIASGTGRYNVYMAGTADNYFAGNVGIGTSSPAVKLAISSTDAVLVPKGTAAQRPTGVSGYLRFNTDNSSFEGYNGTAWAAVGGGNTTTYGMWENANTISANYTITTNNNATSAGPITVNSGVSVTIPSGSRWVIL